MCAAYSLREKNSMKFAADGIHIGFLPCYAYQQPVPQRTPRLHEQRRKGIKRLRENRMRPH